MNPEPIHQLFENALNLQNLLTSRLREFQALQKQYGLQPTHSNTLNEYDKVVVNWDNINCLIDNEEFDAIDFCDETSLNDFSFGKYASLPLEFLTDPQNVENNMRKQRDARLQKEQKQIDRDLYKKFKHLQKQYGENHEQH